MRFAAIFATNRKIPLYVTYLYPTILAAFIVLRTFSVELQSGKTNSYEKRLPRLLLQAFFSPAWFKTVSRKLVLELNL